MASSNDENGYDKAPIIQPSDSVNLQIMSIKLNGTNYFSCTQAVNVFRRVTQN